MATTKGKAKSAGDRAERERVLNGKVRAVSISREKGTKKTPIRLADFVRDQGIQGDAHSGKGIRQVSLLALESIEKIRQKGLDVGPGDFGENITLAGIEIHTLPLGAKIKLGSTVLLELTQIGKECVERCAIYYQAGDCVMPREGVFARVLTGGRVQAGDDVLVVPGRKL